MSNNPPPRWPIVLSPPPDGTLLCVWLPSYADILRAVSLVSRLVILPTCGVQHWPHTSRVLFVVWTDREGAPIVRGLLSVFGDVTDWPHRLPLSGDWAPFGGTPLFADKEYEETPC